jgi:lipopolysaccharide/colanic/teichoic acid biosynthesis glycosyltransferase
MAHMETVVPNSSRNICQDPRGSSAIRRRRTERSVRAAAIEERTRRLVDIVGSLLALAVCGPLMLVIAILVKLDSPGPILFRHVRVGRNRRESNPGDIVRDRRRRDDGGPPFVFFKYRTMYVDARERFPELYSYTYTSEELEALPIKVLVGKKGNPSAFKDGPRPELMDDPRVTRIGRWLRRTSLDELPNFFNVLRGDMSLVGPRPDIAENIRYYFPNEMTKLTVKPGVTGLAQVRGRGFLPFHTINSYDVHYVQRRSVWLDLRILIETVFLVVTRHGAF